MTRCPCGTHHSHPTREHCAVCAGWACAYCGRCKTPERETCGRVACKRKYAPSTVTAQHTVEEAQNVASILRGRYGSGS